MTGKKNDPCFPRMEFGRAWPVSRLGKIASLPLFLIIAILSLSCAHHSRVAKHSTSPEFSTPIFKRHITNAVYAGEGDLVGKELQKKLTADPDNLKLRLELATHYRQGGHPELAVEHCRLGAQRFPESGEIQLLMAKSFNDMGMQKEAADTLQSFLERKPQTDPSYYSWLGIIRDEQGEWKTGESCHRTALTLANQDYLHNNLGYNLLRQGKKEQAAEEFRKALALHPDSTIARNNLGLALASNPREALLNWQSVSGSGPAADHNKMASTFVEQGRYAEAERELKRALEYNRLNPAILENLKLVSEMQKNPVVLPNTPHGSRMRRAASATWRAVSGQPPKVEKKMVSEEVVRTASR